jgi:hypothetical protein
MDTLEQRNETTENAERRATYLTGLLWHIGVFLIINGFFWAIDLALGEEGVQWAMWITAIWSFALAFHVLAYLIDGRQVRERKTRQYLDEHR